VAIKASEYVLPNSGSRGRVPVFIAIIHRSICFVCLLLISFRIPGARSETMVPYLRLMGLSEMAIEAWTKAEMETDTYKVCARTFSGGSL